jgi:hypothetical protein
MNTQMQSMAMVRKLAQGELSLKARLGYVALLLVSSVMTAAIVSLWLTEAYLPLRAQIAFGAMSLIGISWAALATWALTTRRILLARDRVLAGRMSVAFTGLFLAGTIVAVVITATPAAFAALAAGVSMFIAALCVLAGARRRFAELAERRAQLNEGCPH